MAESKSRLLHILKYLWQNTDEEHLPAPPLVKAVLPKKTSTLTDTRFPQTLRRFQRAGLTSNVKEQRNLYYLSSRTFELRA